MSVKRTILVFVKNPVPGRVKTRLAAVLGEEVAADLYRAFVEDVVAMCRATGVAVTVMVSPEAALEEVRAWLGIAHRYVAQKGEDLGERMSNAFQGAFQAGCEEAVLIGSDLPDLPRGILEEAFRQLTMNECVIGPAADGGYYAVGFRAGGFQPSVFQGVEWSTGSVCRRTCELLRMNGVRYHLLETWEDVDTLGDLSRFAERIAGSEQASRTRLCLSRYDSALEALSGHSLPGT